MSVAILSFLYRNLVLPLVVILLRILKPIFPVKLRRIIDDRDEYPQLKKYTQPPVLIHAASGELEYAKPLIRWLRTHSPGTPIVLTYFSPSALRLIEGLPVDEVLPLPFDLTRDQSDFLDRLRPSMVLVARTDVWPEMARQCRIRDIPVILFSATFSRPLARKFWMSRTLDRWRFENLRLVAPVSDEDETNFRSLKLSTPTAVLGDTRYEQVIERLKDPKKLPFTIENDARFTGVLGSTWFEDDQVWIDALTEPDLRANFRWIWVPHEVSLRKIQELIEQLKTSGFKVEKLSDIDTWRSDILVVDRTGLLAELYRRADVAFVGGSFRAKVHSVMEPLAAGCPVVLGPHCDNNREAQEFRRLPLIQDQRIVSIANDGEGLRAWLRGIHPHLGNRRLREQIVQKVEERAHVTEKLMAELIERKIFEPRADAPTENS
ncbi:MAG: hypothetical protein KF767_13480 [Bdellovibrionaceae bacterium]|nr:hypothetical protein [Pseudobdellovibrionaceae bacterium]